VFANQKGGVGKTTVTLGVAAELAARREGVLVVGLDAPASATQVPAGRPAARAAAAAEDRAIAARFDRWAFADQLT